MTASQPDISAARLLDRIEAGQISRPSRGKEGPCPNYRAGWGFPEERCRAKLPGLSFTFPSEASYCDEPIPVLTEQNGRTITAALRVVGEDAVCRAEGSESVRFLGWR
jgi:hypothetical protein